MIHGLHLVNFANHRDTTLFFPRLTALVGENGAGKSNALRALEIVSKFAKSEAADRESSLFGSMPIEQENCRIGGGLMSIGVSGSGHQQGKAGQWGLLGSASLPPAFVRAKPGFIDLSGTWYWNNKLNAPCSKPWVPAPPTDSATAFSNQFKAMKEAALSNSPDNNQSIATLPGIPAEATDALSGTQYFKAVSENLGHPSYPEQLPPRLLANGENLASIVALMMTSDRERFEGLLRALQAVVPSVQNIRTNRAAITRMRQRTVSVNRKDVAYDEEQVVHGDQLIFDMASGKGIGADKISEGTLLTLGLLTLLHSNPAPKLVLLDDIERGLHPRAQRDLMKQLRAILEMRPELQVILSSHSPYIIDQLSPEEVWLLAPADDGCAVARRLSDHPNASKALEVLSTGEFWSAEGEDWIVKEAQKPAA